VMLDALAESFGRECRWTHPQGGLFIWATLPDYIDTTDLLARALDQHVAFVPGRAAFLDGRGGSSMRLNFSGVGEADIREGVRRIGEVVREQIELYGTLTGSHAIVAPLADPAPAALDEELADVLHLPAPASSSKVERRRRAGGSEIREG
jgi:2-aminoadipate transaminase